MHPICQFHETNGAKAHKNKNESNEKVSQRYCAQQKKKNRKIPSTKEMMKINCIQSGIIKISAALQLRGIGLCTFHARYCPRDRVSLSLFANKNNNNNNSNDTDDTDDNNNKLNLTVNQLSTYA